MEDLTCGNSVNPDTMEFSPEFSHAVHLWHYSFLSVCFQPCLMQSIKGSTAKEPTELQQEANALQILAVEGNFSLTVPPNWLQAPGSWECCWAHRIRVCKEMRTAHKPVADSQRGRLCPWGVCMAFCGLKCYECFKLLLNLASHWICCLISSVNSPY